MLLLMLFFVGGCAESAGGEIKVGQNTIPPDLLLSIFTFFGIYIATGVLGSVIISLSGTDMLTSFAASFLCLGNIGIGFGGVGPTGNFAAFPSYIKWVCSLLMLVGWLELFTKAFWRR